MTEARRRPSALQRLHAHDPEKAIPSVAADERAESLVSRALEGQLQTLFTRSRGRQFGRSVLERRPEQERSPLDERDRMPQIIDKDDPVVLVGS